MKPKQIRKRYGRKVARIVKACTETLDGKLPRSRRHRATRPRGGARKQEAIDHLAAPGRAAARCCGSRRADALANARSIVADLRRTARGRGSGSTPVRSTSSGTTARSRVILAARHPGVLSDELRATVVTEMEELSRWWFDVGDPQPGRADAISTLP